MDAPPVQYITTSDGDSVPYTVTGQGRPLVMLPVPFYSIQRLWSGERGAAWSEGLSGRFRLIQYDLRTQPLARDRAIYPSIDGLVDDLQAVISRLNLANFVLLGWAGFAHVALRYAVANPGRVEALVLGCSAIIGETNSPQALYEALPAENWELFLQALLPPGLSLDERNRELELLRQSASQKTALTGVKAARSSDVADILPLVNVPTLVIHPRDFVMLPIDESAKLAAGIQDARMVQIDGDDMLGDHVQGLKAIDDFLAGVPHGVTAGEAAYSSQDRLSAREVEVLRLIAAGRSNAQIADELVISASTVAKHVSSIFDKTGATNRADATAYAYRNALV